MKFSCSLSILSTAVLLFSGCGGTHALFQPDHSRAYSLSVQTTDAGLFLFHQDRWTLNHHGISGLADHYDRTGGFVTVDTVLSYLSVASTGSGTVRGNTMEQFLLTILGVVLVIGLAGLMLYAAFRATER